MFKFRFSCVDNSGFRQSFIVKANSKLEAIDKGFARAKKHAKGDIVADWHCALALGA